LPLQGGPKWSEKGAIAKYKQAAAKATDPGLKKMFTEMMEEEKIHVRLIEDKIEQMKKKTKQEV